LWQDAELVEAAAGAGLPVVRTLGQRTGAVLDPEPDGRHTKVVYVARRPEELLVPGAEGGGRMIVEP
jgi:hypothetical protein